MQKAKGFTIIETIIALIIIVIIAVGAFEFLQYCQRFLIDSDLRLMAVNLARETMEEQYWNLDLADITDSDPLPDGVLKDKHGGERNYSIADDPTGTYKTIKITIDWD